MADNQILIDLIAKPQLDQAIQKTNYLKLSLEQLKIAANMATSNRIPFIFDAPRIDKSQRAWARLNAEISRSIPILARVYVEAQKSGAFALALSSGGAMSTIGQKNLATIASSQLALPAPSTSKDLVPYTGGGGNGPVYTGQDVPSGGGGNNNRFNFGQIFSGFLALGAAQKVNSFIKDSVDSFAELEFTLKRVQIVLKPTQVGFNELKDTILDLSRVVPVSISDLSEASITIAQAGVKNLDELKATLVTTSLVALRFGDSLQKTALDMITVANEFNIPFKDLAKVAGVISIVSGDTVANIRDLGEALGQVGPGARILGVSIEETAVSLGVARDVAIDASRAGTNLRNLFTQLEKLSEGVGTNRQEKVLSKLGLTLKDVNIKTQGYTSVLSKLSSAHMTLADAQELVQQRNGVLLLALLESARGADFAQSKFGKLLEKTRTGADLFKDFAEQVGTVKANQIILGNAFERLKIHIGESFGVFLNVIRPALVAFLNIIASIPAPVIALTLVFSSFFLALLGLSLIVPVLANAFSSVLGGAINLTIGIFTKFIPMVFGLTVQMLPLVLMVWAAAAAIEGFSASLRSGNDPLRAFASMIIDYAIAPIKGLALIIKAFVGPDVRAMIDSGVRAIEKIPKALLGIQETNTTGVITDLNKRFEELIATITDSKVAKELEEWYKSMTHFTEGVEKAQKATEIFRYRVKDLTIQSQEDFQAMVHRMIPTWTDAIYDLITGAKTFGDVWKDIQNQALKDFIHGFLEGMIGSWNESLGQMLAKWIFFSQATGQGAGGGLGGILGSIGSLFGGGGLAGAVGGAANTFSGVTSVTNANPYRNGIPGFADGGIATKPTFGVFGEDGPEALIPLDRLGKGGGAQTITVVNVVDRNFVSQALTDDPDVIINTINADLIRNGTTRRTIKRYTQ